MVYGYNVKKNGVWYMTGQEVPDDELTVEDVMPKPEIADVPTVDFSSMEVEELKELAVSRGIELPKRCGKATLIKLLSE